MALNIQTNVASLEAQRNTMKNQTALTKSFARLSSGFRVNSAADDAAGLGISESMKAQIRSYTVAERNANDAISMTQTAEASLGEMHDILGRMRELATQAANGSMGANDRGYLDTEFTQLKDELTRIQGSTKFNGNLLVANAVTSVTFQVGLNNEANDQITVNFGGLTLGAILSANLTTANGALTSLSDIDTAISTVSTSRASFGSVMNRMDVTISSIQTMRINLSAANSRIRDVDVAEETSKLSKNQVLTQAGVSILAQANQIPQSAMTLLGGR
jgi:flagellin